MNCLYALKVQGEKVLGGIYMEEMDRKRIKHIPLSLVSAAFP